MDLSVEVLDVLLQLLILVEDLLRLFRKRTIVFDFIIFCSRVPLIKGLSPHLT